MSLIWGKAVSGVYIELQNTMPLLKCFAVLLLFTIIIGCGGIMTFVCLPLICLPYLTQKIVLMFFLITYSYRVMRILSCFKQTVNLQAYDPCS